MEAEQKAGSRSLGSRNQGLAGRQGALSQLPAGELTLGPQSPT